MRTLSYIFQWCLVYTADLISAVGQSLVSSSRRQSLKARRFFGEHLSAYLIEQLGTDSLVLRNGPAGVFEFDNFAGGSKATLDAAIEAAGKGSTVIVGGGDTATVCASAAPVF